MLCETLCRLVVMPNRQRGDFGAGQTCANRMQYKNMLKWIVKRHLWVDLGETFLSSSTEGFLYFYSAGHSSYGLPCHPYLQIVSSGQFSATNRIRERFASEHVSTP